MDNIIVTSGGFNTINNYVSEDNIKMFERVSKGKKVLVIANAAPKYSGNYIARENVKNNFLNVGAVLVDIIDLDKDNLDIILDYDIVYGLGGNLTHLIELNQKTNFKNMLLKFLDKGIYIGESAGSMILSDDVKYIYDLKKGMKPKYDIVLDSYEGLGLINTYIYPHYQKANEDMQMKIDHFESDNGITITKMNDGDIITYNYNSN